MQALIVGLVLTAAFAQDLVPRIEDANKKVKMDPPCATCTGYGYATYAGFDDNGMENLKSCFRAICGRALDQHEPKAAGPVHDPKLPALIDAVNEYIAAANDSKDAFRKMTEDMSKVEQAFHSETLRLSAWNQAVTAPLEYIAKAHLLGLKLTASDRAELVRHATAKAYAGTEQALVPIVEKLAQDRRLVAASYDEVGAAYKYRMMYPNDDFQAATQRDLRETKRAIQTAPTLVKNLITSSGLDRDLAFQEVRIKGRTVDEIDAHRVQEITDKIQVMVRSYDSFKAHPELQAKLSDAGFAGFKAAMQKPYVLEAMNHEAVNAEVKAMSPENLMGVAAEFEMQTLSGGTLPNLRKWDGLSAAYSTCISRLDESARDLPNENELEQFNKSLTEYRRRIKASLRGHFSAETQKTLSAYVDRVQFSVPPSRSGFMNKAIEFLKYRAQAFRAARKAVDSDFKTALVNAKTSLDIGRDLRDDCKSLEFRPIRDNTVATLDAVAVGSKAVRDPKFGFGIVAHEVSHGLFKVLSDKKHISKKSLGIFESAKRCLVDNHKALFDGLEAFNKTVPAEKRDLRERTHYLGEDFADTGAGLSSPEPGYGCDFRDGEWPGLDLENMMVENDRRFPPDTHSRDTFRILHTERESSRNFPAACDAYLKSKQSPMKKCL